MQDLQQRIDILERQLAELSRQHAAYAGQIVALKRELMLLKADATPAAEVDQQEEFTSPQQEAFTTTAPASPRPAAKKANLEKLIGENLMSKIGIVVMVLGITIGVKYAIEHNQISPLFRILNGYITGFVIGGLAIWLKKKYKNFSAVLMGGSLATLFFVTYAACDIYYLLHVVPALLIMTVITVAAVVAAIHYNIVFIAHMGLVGAYAIPFLLGKAIGNREIQLAYIFIINCGILFIAYRRYWKSLYYVAFILTWLTFTVFYLFDGSGNKSTLLTFILLNYLQFLSITLVYKLVKKELFARADVAMLLLNGSFLLLLCSVIFNGSWEPYFGAFILLLAMLHAALAWLVVRKMTEDQHFLRLLYLVALAFATAAVPVQLDGAWITVLWGVEAAALFYIFRSSKVVFYEQIAFILLMLATISFGIDIMEAGYNATPFFNVDFMNWLIFATACGFTWYQAHRSEAGEGFTRYITGGLFIAVLYAACRHQLAIYFMHWLNERPADSNDIRYIYQNIWMWNFTAAYLVLLSLANIYRVKSTVFSYALAILNIGAIAWMLTMGLYSLNELRDRQAALSSILSLRYLAFGLVAGLCYSIWRHTANVAKSTIETIGHLVILIILSSELIFWVETYKVEAAYKTSLSILWGAYALLLIVLGIRKHRQHLRLTAIGIFAVTLFKLFLYDLSAMGTIARTIVFVLLGVLMLIISFLYNKYKNLLFGEDEETNAP